MLPIYFDMSCIKQGESAEGLFVRYRKLVEKRVDSLEWMQKELLCMDEIAHPLMGISSWDDAVATDFVEGRLVASIDGPYAKRLVMKSALVHAATDVVVKGARPIYALDAMIGSEEDIRDMLYSLKEQSLAVGIPLLGGNTMVGEAEPKCSIAVLGRLVIKEPIRDSGAMEGDVLALVGEPIWGGRSERLLKARALFDAWFTILGEGITINASKDVTKGGLVSTLYELSKKSGREFGIREDIPFPLSRNLDNFLVSVSPGSLERIMAVCGVKNCSVTEVGRVL